MKRPARIAAICLTVGGGAVTLLLWSKLKLVAGIPRTVYAEPELDKNDANSQGSEAEPADDRLNDSDESGSSDDPLDPTSK